MGNLARASFPTSTKAVWPWSYDYCDETVPFLDNRQEINACTANPGHGLNPFQGRGSPEIDIFEVNSLARKSDHLKRNSSRAFMSSSLQISPGVSKPNRPLNGHPLNDSYVWYENIHINQEGELNSGFWGQEV